MHEPTKSQLSQQRHRKKSDAAPPFLKSHFAVAAAKLAAFSFPFTRPFHHIECGLKSEIVVARSMRSSNVHASASLSLRRASKPALHDLRQTRRLSMTCWSGPHRLSREAVDFAHRFSHFAQGSRKLPPCQNSLSANVWEQLCVVLEVKRQSKAQGRTTDLETGGTKAFHLRQTL